MDSKELKKGKKVRITSLPYFDDDNREIRLKLDGFSNEMVISGIDYRCVNEKLFRMELRKDSIINIQYQNNRIYSIAKNGVQYLNLKKANIEKRKSNRLGIALGVVFMIMTSIGIFNKEEPSISFGILLVVACFLTALFFR